MNALCSDVVPETKVPSGKSFDFNPGKKLWSSVENFGLSFVIKS